MRYIAKPSIYTPDFIWTGQVEDDYTLQPTEIFITEEQHTNLQGSGKYATITDGILQINESEKNRDNTNARARKLLNEGDWKVIRELERLYLSGTDLNTEREALRSSITE